VCASDPRRCHFDPRCRHAVWVLEWIGPCFIFKRNWRYVCILACYLGQEFVHKVLGTKITGIDRELDHAGFIYATSLRLIPGIPFFGINKALGLTTIGTATFYFSTQIGMLLMLGILVNAGISQRSIPGALNHPHGIDCTCCQSVYFSLIGVLCHPNFSK
jgi:uncharacterized membrane protein YdjX (TVP38/TMEM64 family)